MILDDSRLRGFWMKPGLPSCVPASVHLADNCFAVCGTVEEDTNTKEAEARPTAKCSFQSVGEKEWTLLGSVAGTLI